jgi:hypothetical protein
MAVEMVVLLELSMAERLVVWKVDVWAANSVESSADCLVVQTGDLRAVMMAV